MEVKSEICKSKGKRWYKETVCMYFMPSFWKSRESLDESEITHRGKRRVDPVLFLLYWELPLPYSSLLSDCSGYYHINIEKFYYVCYYLDIEAD